MGVSLRVAHFSRVCTAGIALCLGCGGALGDPPESGAPAGNFFSSLKQAINQNFDHEVVRGHFDVGAPPHRYYCLIDPKTGLREANGVAGQPVLRPDGMTGIKSPAVAFYSCANAEQQGSLVTSGYVTGSAAAAAATVAPPAQQQTAPAAAVKGVSADKVSTGQIDVAGVRLGMSPDQVRAVLKSKKLLEYYESGQTLGAEPSTNAVSAGVGRFVNIIAAWTSPPSSLPAGGEGAEAYEVMFTPVPGSERAIAIVHSAAYSPADAVRETTVESALVTKYGGYSGSAEMPNSPTWRIQKGGTVLVGDACNRRGIFGGLGELHPALHARQNIVLKTTLEEFRFQIENCGVAIVTEDQATANADAPPRDRVIARFTVTAYSPSLGFEGAAAAAQIMQSAGTTVDKTKAPRTRDQPAPNL